MKVLKFGGSSVANAGNIEKVAQIVRYAAADCGCVVILSALQGTTDMLIAAGKMAAHGDNAFLEKIGEIRARHSETLNGLFPDGIPEDLERFVETALSEFESTCEGVLRVRELSGRT